MGDICLSSYRARQFFRYPSRATKGAIVWSWKTLCHQEQFSPHYLKVFHCSNAEADIWVWWQQRSPAVVRTNGKRHACKKAWWGSNAAGLQGCSRRAARRRFGARRSCTKAEPWSFSKPSTAGQGWARPKRCWETNKPQVFTIPTEKAMDALNNYT